MTRQKYQQLTPQEQARNRDRYADQHDYMRGGPQLVNSLDRLRRKLGKTDGPSGVEWVDRTFGEIEPTNPSSPRGSEM